MDQYKLLSFENISRKGRELQAGEVRGNLERGKTYSSHYTEGSLLFTFICCLKDRKENNWALIRLHEPNEIRIVQMFELGMEPDSSGWWRMDAWVEEVGQRPPKLYIVR